MGNDMNISANILVIDDSLFILKLVESILSGKYNVQAAQTAEKAYAFLHENIPDLILLDLEMPKTNGYDIMLKLKGRPEWRDIPVIFFTGMDDNNKEEKALTMGAVDYILKPISVGVLAKRIQMHLELVAYQKKLESLVDLRTGQLLKTQDLILDILANVTTYRDNDTGAHIVRTTNYSKLIVEKLMDVKHPSYMINQDYANNIIKTTKLHDIGKIGISDDILLKKGKLTPFEFEIIKMHTTLGAQMIESAIIDLGENANFLVTAKEIILHHHEWWNGEGYPMKLKGAEIPISARVMAIADVYDALISTRPYKKAFPHEDALSIMKRETGMHFDSVLMELVDGLFPEFKKIAETYKDD